MAEKIWVPYAVDNHGIYGPVVNVVLTGPNGTPFPTRAKVDSGASRSTFPLSYVAQLGIETSHCVDDHAITPIGKQEVLAAVKESVKVHIAEVDASYQCNPLFFGKSVLLGRDDAFEMLRVTFEHRELGMFLELYDNK